MNPKRQQDQIVIVSLFDTFPSVAVNHQRQKFTSLVKSIAQRACYILSLAWGRHGSVAEAEAYHNSLFGQCWKYFLTQVDAFRNESAQRLILGDLMLLNPNLNESRAM